MAGTFNTVRNRLSELPSTIHFQKPYEDGPTQLEFMESRYYLLKDFCCDLFSEETWNEILSYYSSEDNHITVIDENLIMLMFFYFDIGIPSFRYFFTQKNTANIVNAYRESGLNHIASVQKFFNKPNPFPKRFSNYNRLSVLKRKNMFGTLDMLLKKEYAYYYLWKNPFLR